MKYKRKEIVNKLLLSLFTFDYGLFERIELNDERNNHNHQNNHNH